MRVARITANCERKIIPRRWVNEGSEFPGRFFEKNLISEENVKTFIKTIYGPSIFYYSFSQNFNFRSPVLGLSADKNAAILTILTFLNFSIDLNNGL